MKKLTYGKKVVGLILIVLSVITILIVQKNYSKESIDSINKIIHNNEYKIKSRFVLNESYYSIIKEAEKRRLIAEQNERWDKLKAEKEAELEKQRLAKLEEEKKKKEKVNVSRGEATKYASDWMTFEGTYYTAKCKGCSGFTKTEYDVRNTIYYNGYRIIAADTSVLPLYTLVEVITPYESFKAIVLDTGGAIKNRKTDILVSTYDEAVKKGRHNIKIRVIKYGN